MSERVFVWRGGQSDISAAFAPHDGVEIVYVTWSNALEAFIPDGADTAMHLCDMGPLDGRWLVFLDVAATAWPIAVMLDYARYYGLRTAAICVPGDGLSSRPESIALDAILVREESHADALREAWRGHDLDMASTPPITLCALGADRQRLLELLDAAPAVPSLVVLEGARHDASDLAARFGRLGVAPRTLRWDEAQAALLPVPDDAFRPARDLAGEWALLPLTLCRDCAEAMAIVDEAKGLGLKVAIEVGDYALDPEYGRLPLHGAEVVFFATGAQREAALADAFRFDERIALLRERWRVAADAPSIIRELSALRERLNSSQRYIRPRTIEFLDATPFESALHAAMAPLARAEDGVDWLIVSSDAAGKNLPALRTAKAAGKKIAAILDCDIDAADAETAGALGAADVLLPTRWPLAAQLIRALALAGASRPKIIPCPPARDMQRAIDWRAYAVNVVDVLSRAAAAPGWPTTTIVQGLDRPLLTCAITTYNRAPWLRHSLKSLLDAAAPWRDRIEILVCDNASTDDTQNVAQELLESYDFAYHRNPVNVGMLGNLGATARHCRGAYVWVIGDDDLVVAEGLKRIVESLERHPDAEMVYLNYAYTRFNDPAALSDAQRLIEEATPIGFGGADRYAARLAEVAGFNENLFTAIYACVFRRDHALRAYQLDTRGAPFSSLPTCVPSSVYTLSALPDRPAVWIGFPSIVVNMNVSWLRWALLWRLERMPDLFDLAERAGVDQARVDRHRYKHAWHAGGWLHEALVEAEDAIRSGVSVARLIERCKHLDVFKAGEGAKIMASYRAAWAAGRVVADVDPPDILSTRYGLVTEPQIACAEEKL